MLHRRVACNDHGNALLRRDAGLLADTVKKAADRVQRHLLEFGQLVQPVLAGKDPAQDVLSVGDLTVIGTLLRQHRAGIAVHQPHDDRRAAKVDRIAVVLQRSISAFHSGDDPLRTVPRKAERHAPAGCFAGCRKRLQNTQRHPCLQPFFAQRVQHACLCRAVVRLARRRQTQKALLTDSVHLHPS